MDVRRRTQGIVLATMLILCLAAPAGARTEVYLNAEQLSLAKPLRVQDGYVMVPVESFVTELNGKTAVDEARLDIQVWGRQMSITLGLDVATVDGEPVSLDVPAQVVGQTFYVPLSLFLQALRLDIAWDGANRSVRLSSQLRANKAPEPVEPPLVDTPSTDQVQAEEAPSQVLRRAEFEPRDGFALLTLKVPGTVDYEVQRLIHPDRLVIDLADVAYPGDPLFPESLFVADSMVRGVRVSQYKTDTTRVVVDLRSPAVASRLSSLDEASLTFKIGKGIERIGLAPARSGDAIIIQGTDTLDPIVTTLTGPNRLVIDVPGTILPHPVADVIRLDGPIRRLKAAQFTPDTVRIVAEMPEWLAWDVRSSPDGRSFVIVLNRASLMGYTIVVDPGHGGIDGGTGQVDEERALGIRRMLEKEIVLDIGKRLTTLLREAGASVVMTRTQDVFIPLPQRPAVANQLGADVFISLHANAAPNRLASGSETYYLDKSGENQVLAASIHSEVLSSLQTVNRGIRAANFSVLRNSDVPAVLVEVAFMSNREEGRLLAQTWFRQRAAEGVFNGLVRYFGRRDGLKLRASDGPQSLQMSFLAPKGLERQEKPDSVEIKVFKVSEQQETALTSPSK